MGSLIAQFKSLVVAQNWAESDIEKTWGKMFIRPVETRWLVKWTSMELLEDR